MSKYEWACVPAKLVSKMKLFEDFEYDFDEPQAWFEGCISINDMTPKLAAKLIWLYKNN